MPIGAKSRTLSDSLAAEPAIESAETAASQELARRTSTEPPRTLFHRDGNVEARTKVEIRNSAFDVERRHRSVSTPRRSVVGGCPRISQALKRDYRSRGRRLEHASDRRRASRGEMNGSSVNASRRQRWRIRVTHSLAVPTDTDFAE